MFVIAVAILMFISVQQIESQQGYILVPVVNGAQGMQSMQSLPNGFAAGYPQMGPAPFTGLSFPGWNGLTWKQGVALTRMNIWKGCGWFKKSGCNDYYRLVPVTSAPVVAPKPVVKYVILGKRSIESTLNMLK